MSTAYRTYIIEHVSNVIKAYNWLVEHNITSESLRTQISLHDVSKYSDHEYDAYDNYFYGRKTEKVKSDFNYAWLHHIHNNPHHWQHWVLVNDEDGTQALEMPKEYVIEMICDWWAFSHKSGNLYEIFDWYKSHKKNMILHDKTKKLVEEILDRIKQELDKDKAIYILA
jgi:hypothetical protein